ncbi:MAG: hypothetical protein RL653_4290 [Pseudomonadota bacterium]|jgi:hypothetical protein
MIRLLLATCLLASPLALAQASSPEHDCGLLPPELEPREPVPTRPFERPVRPGEPPLVQRTWGTDRALRSNGIPQPTPRTGALAGKHVYLSQGHGFTYTNTLSRWATQRGNTQQIVEDLVSAESMNQWLIPMLQLAGATVFPIRESDFNPAMVVVDDSGGGYSEVGAPALFSASSEPGMAPLPAKLDDRVNPFARGATRLLQAASAPSAHADFVPSLPADGYYSVYVTYSAKPGRVTDAHYVVRHAGGETHFRLNQQRHGSTWILLGRFFFRAGAPAERASVQVWNDTAGAGSHVSVDAVRFGGGMGLVERQVGSAPLTTSGRPRAEESSRYAAQFNGAPQAVYDPNGDRDDRNDDISTRSRYTAWAHESGEDAVFISWHTNASGTGGRGTEVFVYGPGAPNTAYEFTGVPGSEELAQKVYAELVGDIKAAWDPAWKTRGVKSAYFGELGPLSNPETPAILMEMAFHDQVDDAAQLKHPRFRYLLTRAVLQGVIKYFAAKDGTPVNLPPEPPTALAARNLGGGQVELRWAPPTLDVAAGQEATTWIVYQGRDGLSWDDGTPVDGMSLTMPLSQGELRYFRVSGVNAGGESFPSQAVGVVGSPTPAPVLIVNGFDRLDSTLGRSDDLSNWNLGNVFRVAQLRMNDGTYVRHHGDAVAAAGRAFDSATHGALAEGLVSLQGYLLVDWIAGRGQQVGTLASVRAGPPPDVLLAALQAWVEAGGRLVVSGSSFAGALAAGSGAAQAFLQQVLGAQVGTGSGAPPLSGSPGGVLDGLAGLQLDDGLGGTYPAGGLDVLTAAGGQVWAVEGTGGAAAVGKTTGAGASVLLAFPVETVLAEDKRRELVARLLAWGSVPNLPQAPVADGGTPGGEDAGTPGEPVVLEGVPGGVSGGPRAAGCGCAGAGLSPLAGWALLAAFAWKTGRSRRR